MIELPKEIKSIEVLFVENKFEKIRYVINKGTTKEYTIYVESPYIERPKKSFDIINESGNFVNGFKVVQTANKQYAYVKEEDNTLLPYRYDVATDFNEYGYAMVGKDRNISWIDKKFKYLCSNGKMIEENINDKPISFKGFDKISNFSKGTTPLSKVCRREYYDLPVSYFGIDGKFKKFYWYNYDRVCDLEGTDRECFPLDSTSFDDKGYATFHQNEYILLSSGYYLSTEDLIRICEEKGFLDTISSEIKKQEQGYTKLLRDVEKMTMSFVDNLSKVNNFITEYSIGRIELKKEELISRYGRDVYRRALFNHSLAFLINNQEFVSEIVDLKLLQSSLAKRGIPSYIDNEENVFHYNTNKHVKVKKQSTC